MSVCTQGIINDPFTDFGKRIAHLEKLVNEINSRTIAYPATRDLITDNITLLQQRMSIVEKDLEVKIEDHTKKNIFEFKNIDVSTKEAMKHIDKVLYEFYCWILDNVEKCSDRSIAIERLKECAMWLNKSISRRKDHDRQQKG